MGIKGMKILLVIYILILWNFYEIVWVIIMYEIFCYDVLWNWLFISGIFLNFMMNCFILFLFWNVFCFILGVKSLGIGKYDFSVFVFCIINWVGNLYKIWILFEDWLDIFYILVYIKWEIRLIW